MKPDNIIRYCFYCSRKHNLPIGGEGEAVAGPCFICGFSALPYIGGLPKNDKKLKNIQCSINEK